MGHIVLPNISDGLSALHRSLTACSPDGRPSSALLCCSVGPWGPASSQRARVDLQLAYSPVPPPPLSLPQYDCLFAGWSSVIDAPLLERWAVGPSQLAAIVCGPCSGPLAAVAAAYDVQRAFRVQLDGAEEGEASALLDCLWTVVAVRCDVVAHRASLFDGV